MDAVGATMELIGCEYCNVSLELKRIEMLHILFSNIIETS